jgi:uncharacterized protein DUF5658
MGASSVTPARPIRLGMPGHLNPSALNPVFRGLWGPMHRPRRVLGLLFAVVILSLADLYMTLVHLLHFGLLEGNPIARNIMEHGSPAALILWKCVTVGLAVGIMAWARKRWAAEAGAAFCCLVLTWLTVQWVAYNDQISRLTPELQTLATTTHNGSDWVSMVPGS